jgi:transposase
MSGLILRASDRSYFLAMMRRQMNSTVHRRMNVLLLLDDGLSMAEIARVLYLDEGTVRAHRELYEREGRAGIERLAYEGRAPEMSARQEQILVAHFSGRVVANAKEFCAFSKARFGLLYTPNAMTKYVKRLGFVYKKPKCVPAKADALLQKRFARNVLLPLMRAANANQPLYFVDATHPAYTGRPAHGWMRKGERCELKSNHGRVNVNINGALCWHDRTLIQLQVDKVTSAAMIALFENIAAHHPRARIINVALDNARYNRSRELRAWLDRPGCRIKLRYLPSYSPNLNLIERLWGFFKKKVVFNKYHPTFADFRKSIATFFRTIGSHKKALATLLTDKFHFIGHPSPGIP